MLWSFQLSSREIFNGSLVDGKWSSTAAGAEEKRVAGQIHGGAEFENHFFVQVQNVKRRD